jgi:hypothetical protein
LFAGLKPCPTIVIARFPKGIPKAILPLVKYEIASGIFAGTRAKTLSFISVHLCLSVVKFLFWIPCQARNDVWIYPCPFVVNFPSSVPGFMLHFMLDFRFLDMINSLIDLKLLEKRVNLIDPFRFDNKESILPVNLEGLKAFKLPDF